MKAKKEELLTTQCRTMLTAIDTVWKGQNEDIAIDEDNMETLPEDFEDNEMDDDCQQSQHEDIDIDG
jgi:hypothetical protein